MLMPSVVTLMLPTQNPEWLGEEPPEVQELMPR